MLENKPHYTICETCKGRGKKRQRTRKRARLFYERGLVQFEAGKLAEKPVKPRGHLVTCVQCHGSGLITAPAALAADRATYPHVAIVGGGIAGVALAVACLHRQIPFTLYERDASFNERSQGYGLTLQQASKAMAGLGLSALSAGIVSTKHVVHDPSGNVVGTWGMRKWLEENNKTRTKRPNIHIARQSLRLALLEQLDGSDHIKWNHQFTGFKETENDLAVSFSVNGAETTIKTDLLVGADGIRSAVRNLVINNEKTPLRYLDCMVILGICKLEMLAHVPSDLLDSATVFQTANGAERIYVMPYDAESVMWQLSFPIPEADALVLSKKGADALKVEAQLRTPWHDPIPQLLAATAAADITGYPVYDRTLLEPNVLALNKKITLIGDAAHPMSPFKGQGANQALLDALLLAREIKRGCRKGSNWRETGIRSSVLNSFEKEMLERSAVKVKDSAAAAKFLHTDAVLHKSNAPRGQFLKDN